MEAYIPRALAAGDHQAFAQPYDEYAPAALRFSGGVNRDSPQEEIYFTRDGGKGSYQITLRYFLEATAHDSEPCWRLLRF